MSKPQSTTDDDMSLSSPMKKYPTFRNYDSNPTFRNYGSNPIPRNNGSQRNSMIVKSQSTTSLSKSHHRTSSAPPASMFKHLEDTDIDIDMDKYEDFILQHCRQLIPNCNCKSCHPPTTLSPIEYNIPFHTMEYARSLPLSPPSSTQKTPTLFTDTRHCIAANCEQSKNISLIQTIGMGIKNSMPRLLNILNDINSRLLLEEYKNQNDFYTFSSNNSRITEEEEEEVEPETDDDDIDIIDDSIHKAFSNLNRLSPIGKSKSCGGEYRDPVPLLNILNKKDASIFDKYKFNSQSWNIFSKIPIHQALHAYQDRIAKPLTFCPKFFIKDSISHYIGQISLITVIVHKLVRAQGMPLQVDVVILSKDAIKNEDWNDMDENKFNLDENGNINIEEKTDEFKNELIEPCSAKCEANKLRQHKFHHYEDDIGDNIMERFYALPDKHHKDHFSHFAVSVPAKGNARKKLGPKLEKNVKLLNETQHGRYVIVIDRQGQRTEPVYKETWLKEKKKKKDKKSDDKHPPRLLKRKTTTKLIELDEHKNDSSCEKDEKDDCFYFFQPPKPYGDIIEGIAMSEAMHMNTLDFLIPAKKTEHCPIGARHLCGGKMFCISFHMMSKDEQKCYLYIDQKCMKIDLKQMRPITDLMRILPHYFKDETFVVLDIMKRLKEIKMKDSERKEFKKCVEELKFNHEDIEDDIAGQYDESKIVEYLKYKSKWRDERIELLYSELCDLFGLSPLLKKGTSTYKANDSNVDNNAMFSTVDSKYDEMINKLGIQKKYKSPL